MSRRKAAVKDEAVKQGWQGYFNYTLTAVDKAAIKPLADDDERIRPALQELLELGYRVSFGVSEKDGVCTVTATGNSETCPNKGYSLSMRHISHERALVALWFVICTRYEGGSWAVDDTALDEFDY